MTNFELMRKIEESKARSAWARGVREYALDLADCAIDYDINLYDANLKGALIGSLLNGAMNWRDYSFGGCSLIYNYDIVDRLCTPSEKRRYSEGKLWRVEWCEVQARALFQAACLIREILSEVK